MELVWSTPNPEQVIEAAGRTCYKSEDKITPDSAGRFVKMIAKNGHESVIEHASASFRIITDRGISHEIVRHRVATSYSQESTRYVCYGKEKFGKEITVIEPPNLDETQRLLWHVACQEAELSYLKMLDAGATPQITRSVLPTCLKTELVMTTNFRAWKHFIALRTSQAAHPQIREIALEIEKILTQLAPNVFHKEI